MRFAARKPADLPHDNTTTRPLPPLRFRAVCHAARSNAMKPVKAASIPRGELYLSLLTRSPMGVALATQLPMYAGIRESAYMAHRVVDDESETRICRRQA